MRHYSKETKVFVSKTPRFAYIYEYTVSVWEKKKSGVYEYLLWEKENYKYLENSGVQSVDIKNALAAHDYPHHLDFPCIFTEMFSLIPFHHKQHYWTTFFLKELTQEMWPCLLTFNSAFLFIISILPSKPFFN